MEHCKIQNQDFDWESADPKMQVSLKKLIIRGNFDSAMPKPYPCTTPQNLNLLPFFISIKLF